RGPAEKSPPRGRGACATRRSCSASPDRDRAPAPAAASRQPEPMRVVALDTDVIVFVSDVWKTTCTAVRAGDEGFVLDSPVYPEELRALPDVLERAGFPVSGLLPTHSHWDHLLGRLAFPEAALGCPESTAGGMA